jgi:diguanylate cyclase (GGDEF)-like protein/PAS domain S-box-containing protein
MTRPLDPGAASRVAVRLVVAVMALAVGGLGGVAVWSAVIMQNEASALASTSAQAGGQLLALQSLSTIRIQTNAMEDGITEERMAALHGARQALPIALGAMERGNAAEATVARKAKPLAVQLDKAVETYLNDPLGDIRYEGDDDGDDTSEDAMDAAVVKIEGMLNGRDINPSFAVSGMLADVTSAESTIRATATVLVPLGLMSAAASAWLLSRLRRRAEERNRAEREQLRTVLFGLPSPVLVTDEADKVVLTNATAAELIGATADTAHALRDLDVRDADGTPVDVAKLVSDARETGRRFNAVDAALTRPDGTVSQITLEAMPLAERDGRIPGVVITPVDVTAQRMYEEHLHFAAFHDSMTGLPNRALFWQHVTTAVSNAVPYAILLIDLDGFKTINDTLGHHIGDELLKGVAGRLRSVGGEHAMAARLGGDEFVILLRGETVAEVTSVVDAAELCFADSFALSCGPVEGRGSVGFAVAQPGQAPDEVMQQADVQMYSTKQRTRSEPRTSGSRTSSAVRS